MWLNYRDYLGLCYAMDIIQVLSTPLPPPKQNETWDKCPSYLTFTQSFLLNNGMAYILSQHLYR